MDINWKLEDDVNDFVKRYFDDLGLKKLEDYNVESSMSDYMKEALRGSAKTENKTNFGKPDFHIEKYNVPVIIENKLGTKKLVSETKKGISTDAKAIQNFAVNGALYYATQMIASGKYKEVIAIGFAGNNANNYKMDAYYVYGTSMQSAKLMKEYTRLDFLENSKTFEAFYNGAKLTNQEKHDILIKGKNDLSKYAKRLNKLMHNHNITAPHRVLYVSGMLLSMQDIISSDGEIIQPGLTPEALKGIPTESRRDGVLIVEQIEEYLKKKEINTSKRNLMLSSFREISKDDQRDEPIENSKEVSKLLEKDASINKQIFTFIYEYVFKQIDSMAGHLDIVGEMYSEFLKYALGDGKEIGIVLTPPYITKLMTELLEIDEESHVMDLAAGSAGFLISAMEIMVEKAELKYGKESTKANEEIKNIKSKQLLGVELNAEMFTLAATNMILRGDGSSNIIKGNSFALPKDIYEDFKPDRLLLNPPFSYEQNGMPFLKLGLDNMKKNGKAAIIVQDSAGSGIAKEINQEILAKHRLVASIKMPTELFVPMAGVQTSIYVFESGIPQKESTKKVKFIDFRNDGYKRSKRKLEEIDHPAQRYEDIVKIYNDGKDADVSEELWDLNDIYVADYITDSGADWNFDQHKKIDLKPTIQDIKKTVSDYLSWEVSNLIKKSNTEDDSLGK